MTLEQPSPETPRFKLLAMLCGNADIPLPEHEDFEDISTFNPYDDACLEDDDTWLEDD